MSKFELLDIWNEGIRDVDPVFLVPKLRKRAKIELSRADAFLFIGKVSERFYESLEPVVKGAVLGIEPLGTGKSRRRPKSGVWIQAEHPLPGKGSFEAGRALLSFIESLKRNGARNLVVLLSGGASSLLWKAPRDPRTGLPMARRKISATLKKLYLQGLDINELNEARAKLCELKAGGAARLLRRAAPQVRAQVYLISDVEPYGPGIVGSGPFRDPSISHFVLASNSTLVKALAKRIRQKGGRVLRASSGRLGTTDEWLEMAVRLSVHALEKGKKGILIFGGEPSVRLQVQKRRIGKGGRQTHLALALADRLRPWFLAGRVEVLAMSSDGSDGNSSAAGAWLDSKEFPGKLRKTSAIRVKHALRRRDSARLLASLGALVPREPVPRSNVQDVLMIRIE